MAENLLKLGKDFVDEKEWSVGLVLAVGAHLLDFSRKVSLGVSEDEICQIILTLLDDAEKADKERLEGSTPKGTSTVPWEDCKMVVKTLFEIRPFCSCLPFGLFSKGLTKKEKVEKSEKVEKEVKDEAKPEKSETDVKPVEIKEVKKDEVKVEDVKVEDVKPVEVKEEKSETEAKPVSPPEPATLPSIPEAKPQVESETQVEL
jgi:hypothetical protein